MNLPEERFNALLLPSPQSSVPALINIGTGEEVSIRELALLIREVVGFAGELRSTPPNRTAHRASSRT